MAHTSRTRQSWIGVLALLPGLTLGSLADRPADQLGWSLATPPELPQLDAGTSPQVAGELAELARQASDGALPRPARGRAAWLLALIHLHGAGIPMQAAAARSWFQLAWELGVTWAAAGLAWCAIEGCDGPANPEAARPWVRALEREDRPRALYLEWLLLERLAPLAVMAARPAPGAGVAPPPPAPPQLLQAAQAGDAQALNELGLRALAADRPDEALRHFEAAAARSRAAAANAARLRERNAATPPPATVPLDETGATDLLAAAQRAHRGQGRPADYTEAIRLYRLADLKGSVTARRMLALIYARPTPLGQLDVTWMRQLAELDLSGDIPRAAAAPGPRREPTALADLLPDRWRDRLNPTPP